MPVSAWSSAVSGLRSAARSNDTTASFTPAANAILYAWICTRGAAQPSVGTITDSSGLSWTLLSNNAFNGTNRACGYLAVTDNAPAAMTVSWNWGSDTSEAAWALSHVTGVNTLSPWVSGTTAQNGGTSTTPNVGTVSAMASSGNLQLLLIATRSASATAEGGWTEVFDFSSGVNNHIAGYTITSPGDTTPTATIGSTAWRAAHIEFAEQVSGAVGTSTALRQGRRRRR